MVITEFTPTPPYPERIVGPDTFTGAPRSRDSRPHLTDIIRDMAEAIGRGKGRSGDPITEEELNWYAAGGWLWEHVWDMAHREAVVDGTLWSPGEVELDGIVGTPDRLRVDEDGGLVVVELKTRWASARKFDDLEKWYWQELSQIAGYAKMVGTVHSELHVFYVAGNWQPPIPTARCARIEWTERELEERWGGIVGHARRKGWLK